VPSLIDPELPRHSKKALNLARYPGKSARGTYISDSAVDVSLFLFRFLSFILWPAARELLRSLRESSTRVFWERDESEADDFAGRGPSVVSEDGVLGGEIGEVFSSLELVM
jgi:hypothetical protein